MTLHWCWTQCHFLGKANCNVLSTYSDECHIAFIEDQSVIQDAKLFATEQFAITIYVPCDFEDQPGTLLLFL